MLYPVRPLLDTDGKRVQAHGGSVFYEGGTYYFTAKTRRGPRGKVRSGRGASAPIPRRTL